MLCVSAVASDRPMSSKASRPSGSEELLLPANYRTWVAISSTTPGLPKHEHRHLAGKLYVEPGSWERFKKTGVWPNRTVIVLELKSGEPVPKGACEIMGLEAAVKDDSRFPDPWSYYGITYDGPPALGQVKPAVGGCTDGSHADTMLTMVFPTLRAMINAKPSTVSPGLL
jgi:hypothetical protein